MSLHPTLKAAVEAMQGQTPMHQSPIDQVRAGLIARMAAVPRPDVAAVEDRAVPGPRGSVPVRIYRPDQGEERPVIVFFHGGGFCVCSVETHDVLCRQICLGTGAVVVSVDYALAPEHKFPAAPDDCLAATLWVAQNAQTFGGDATRIALVGDSAGGALATVTARRLLEAGGPMIAAQALIYPVTDHPTARMPSYTERGAGFGLGTGEMLWFWDHYLVAQAEGLHPNASPNRAEDLAGLPPAYVVTAEYDPLRDEGKAYADRLLEAGVDVTHVRYGDMNHGFFLAAGLDRSDEAIAALCTWLRARLQE